MKFGRYSGILSLVIAIACSGGGGSTGPGGSSGGSGSGGGGGGGSGNDPYGGGGSGSNCPTNSICMLSSTFDPNTLTIAKGTTIQFVNNSAIAHTVNFDGARPPGVDDVPLNSSGTFARTFNDAGTFNFHCTQHAGMTGSVRVQ
jgi:hypothetical protein